RRARWAAAVNRGRLRGTAPALRRAQPPRAPPALDARVRRRALLLCARARPLLLRCLRRADGRLLHPLHGRHRSLLHWRGRPPRPRAESRARALERARAELRTAPLEVRHQSPAHGHSRRARRRRGLRTATLQGPWAVRAVGIPDDLL